MKISVDVDTRKLSAVINRIPLASEAMLDLAADTVLNHAISVVPIDTGALFQSIHIEVVGDGRDIVASTHYASFVEFGTRKMAAQPYLRPAVERLSWATMIAEFFAQLGL